MTENTETSENPQPAFQDQVNNVLAQMVTDDSGKTIIPEEVAKELPEAVVYAAKAEKRLRDTQAAYTKSRQKLKEFETVNSELTQHVIANATLHLNDEEREELDDLRVTDPEQWRAKLNEHEAKAKEIQAAKIEEFKSKGKEVSEQDRRIAAYGEFTERTGISLTDEVIDNQVPASYSKRLASGEWSFDKFLGEVENFLKPSGAIKGAKGTTKDNVPDLGKLPGGSEPTEEAKFEDSVQTYRETLF